MENECYEYRFGDPDMDQNSNSSLLSPFYKSSRSFNVKRHSAYHGPARTKRQVAFDVPRNNSLTDATGPSLLKKRMTPSSDEVRRRVRDESRTVSCLRYHARETPIRKEEVDNNTAEVSEECWLGVPAAALSAFHDSMPSNCLLGLLFMVSREFFLMT